MYIAEFRRKLATSGDEHLVALSKVSNDQLAILMDELSPLDRRPLKYYDDQRLSDNLKKKG